MGHPAESTHLSRGHLPPPRRELAPPLLLLALLSACPEGVARHLDGPAADLADARALSDKGVLGNDGTPAGPDTAQTFTVTKSFGPVSSTESQYSPYVLKQPGWATTLMYYCKNTSINGVHKDRVWRAESSDGVTGWSNHAVVVEGSGDSFLSCSPGVLVDSFGNFNLFYIAASASGTPLSVHQAWSKAPGTSFTQLGEVPGLPVKACAGCLESPSPVLINGKLYLYLIEWGTLYRYLLTWSNNRWNASGRTVASSSLYASHGHVKDLGGTYAFVYSRAVVSNSYGPPGMIFLDTRGSPLGFGAGTLQLQAPDNDTVWYGRRIWSPDVAQTGTGPRIYFAGNNGSPSWWGSGSAIGVYQRTP